MSSTVSRGSYYKRKTKALYESLGYEVQITEFCYMIPGTKFFKKTDIFSSDMIAMNGKEIIFINSKHCTDGKVANQKSNGKLDFEKHQFPSNIKRHVVVWQPKKRPEVFEFV